MKLQVIGIRKDRSNGVTRFQHSQHALAQAWTKDGVGQIFPSLFETGNGIALSHFAPPQTCELGKNKPHPVSAFFPPTEFTQGTFIDIGLRLHKMAVIPVNSFVFQK